MDKVYGKKAQAIVINIRGNMAMIKKMGMGSLLGQLVMYTKGTMKQI